MPHRTSRLLVVLLLLAALAQPTAAAPAAPAPVRITLLQLNDVYQISPLDQGRTGGLARVAALLRQIRATTPNTLFLLGGDTLSPSVASKVFKGAQMIALWNALGLDYATLGNHEFDFGPDVLARRVQESRFQWLAANVRQKRTGTLLPGLRGYAIRSVGGVKVGIFGLLTPDTVYTSKPGNNIVIDDPIQVARRLVPRMRREGAQIVVALTHLTLDSDKALAAAVPGIDVVCGGHEHILLQALVGRTPIFKAASDARNLGRIDILFNRARGRVQSLDWEFIPVNADVAADPAAESIVAGYEHQLDVELGKPVGRTAVPLDARRSTVRTRESNLGNFVTDAFRRHLHADVAITNGGALRGNSVCGAGLLTRKTLVTFLPFENPVIKLEVTGAALRAALEHGVEAAGDPDNGAFPQVSGLTFAYDARKPVGARVVRIRVNGVPLDDARRYTLATTTYLHNGGDGYRMFADARVLVNEEQGDIDSDIVINAVSAVPEIAPQVEGRIERLDPVAP